jgi:hypothetical protein
MPLTSDMDWIISCEGAIQLAQGISVVLLRCPFMPEIIHGRASKAETYSYDLNCDNMT